MKVWPTVVAYDRFNAAKDADKIRIALKGWRTDYHSITDILTKRSNQQRQEIDKYFREHFGHDLLEDLKGGLTRHYKELAVALMRDPFEYLCIQLHKALTDKHSVNAAILVEVLCTKNNAEVEKIIHTFKLSKLIVPNCIKETCILVNFFIVAFILQVYDRSLEEEIMSCNTTDDFRQFMSLILKHNRDETEIVNVIQAEDQARLLHRNGKSELGLNGEILNQMMALDSVDQLRLLFDEYKKLSHQTIHMAIRRSISGELARGLLVIGK